MTCGHVVQRAFDRNRDLLLDLFAGVAGIDRDDDDIRVGDVGVCLDLELSEGPDTERDEAEAEDQRQQPVVKSVGKQAGHEWTLLPQEEHRPVDDDAVAARQTARHDHGILVAGTERDITAFELTAAPLHEHRRATLVLHDGANGHRDDGWAGPA